MKSIGILLIGILISQVLCAQINDQDQKELDKVKKLYEKGELYKSMDKLAPVLKRNPKESELYSLMISYHTERYKQLVVKVTGENAELLNNFKKQERSVYFDDFVNLIREADNNCESVFKICENITKLIELGNEKTTKTSNETYYQAHKEVFDLVQSNKCK